MWDSVNANLIDEQSTCESINQWVDRHDKREISFKLRYSLC
jgi:hypothetical protein